MNRPVAQFFLAFQSLRQAPGFVFSVVMTMACTLAVVFVVAALVNAYFIRPLNVFDEARLYVVEQRIHTEAGTYDGYQSYKGIVHWMRTQKSLDIAAAISPSDMTFTNLPGEPKAVATFASPEYFQLFKVPLIHGRGFDKTLKFDEPNDNALISERMWKRYFNGAENVIGKTLVIQGGNNYTIIGVVSNDYEPPYMFYDGVSDVWLHFGADPRFFNDGEWDNPWNNTYGSLKIVGTAKPGLNQQDVFADFDASIESIRAEWLEGYPNSKDIEPIVRPFRQVELGDKGHLSLYLLAATMGLLLIAVLNVSNLLLSRAMAQHRTLALQAVLGAKRRTLFSSIFAQTFLLMLSSVALALFLAAWGIKGFKYLTDGQLPLLGSVNIDAVVVLAAIVICVLLAWVFALVSSSFVNFSQLRAELQQSGKNTGQTMSARKTRLLVGSQMGIATALILIAAFSLTRTHEVLNRPVGANVKNLHNLTFFIPYESELMTQKESLEKRDQLKQALLTLSQIKNIALGRNPVHQTVSASTLTDAKGVETTFIPQSWVGTEYFEIVGTNIIAGRTISEKAMRGETYEVLVSESVAKMLEPDGDVIGKIYTGHDELHEIVGITEDLNHPHGVERYAGRHVYWSMGLSGYSFVLELHEDANLTRESLLKFARELDNRFILWEFKSLEEELRMMLHIDHITLSGSYLLAAFTLILACVGIFGVLSYNLNMRRFEFGLRMALGAKKVRLYQLLGRDVLLPLLTGCTLASAMTFIILLWQAEGLAQWLSYSPLFAVPAVVLSLAIAVFSGFWPMRRVLQKQPMQALRNE